MRRTTILVSILVLLVAAALIWKGANRALTPAILRLKGQKTVADRVHVFGPAARVRWSPHFARARVAYPPDRVVLVGLKQERRLEVYAADAGGEPRFVRSYQVRGASGGPGPKLREGDLQVPEGIYAIEALNPNSSFHLSLRVGYPNAFDRAMARQEGREHLGADIMIHGGASSVGCLAIGDQAAEDLFILAAETGTERTRVILCPRDFRTAGVPAKATGRPEWVGPLYEQIAGELRRLPSPGG